MIFADLLYEGDYWDHHDKLVALLGDRFATIQHGHQCDSWIWVFENEVRVEVDSFSSMKHQVKCADSASPLVEKVIAVLEECYEVNRYASPELEPHED